MAESCAQNLPFEIQQLKMQQSDPNRRHALEKLRCHRSHLLTTRCQLTKIKDRTLLFEPGREEVKNYSERPLAPTIKGYQRHPRRQTSQDSVSPNRP